MRHHTPRWLRVARSLAALSVVAWTVGCASDPVRPDEWLTEHTLPPQPQPPVVVERTSPVGYAEFRRTTTVGRHSFANGYLLSANRSLLLWQQEGEHWADGWEYATGDFTLTDTVIVLRLQLVSPPSLSLSGVYEVNGILRGDTLRLAYPDSMQQLHPMFSSGDYLISNRQGFP